MQENNAYSPDSAPDDGKEKQQTPKIEKSGGFLSLGRTPGEKLFNFIDYYGIGLFANTALSAWLTDAAEHTWLKPIQHNVSNKWMASKHLSGESTEAAVAKLKAADRFLRHVTKHSDFSVEQQLQQDNLEKLLGEIGTPAAEKLETMKGLGALLEHEGGLAKAFEETSELATKLNKTRGTVNFTLLFSGGWMLLLPIKWLEDAKIPLTRHFDKMLGKKNPSEEELQKREEAYKAIEHEPHQSWISVVLARLSVMPIVMWVFGKTGYQDNVIKKLGGSFENFEGTRNYAMNELGPAIGDGISEMLGEKASKALNRSLEVKPTGLRETFARDLNPAIKEQAELFPHMDGKTRLDRISGIVSLEFLYAIPNATLLFINTHIFAHLLRWMGFDKEKPEQAEQQPAPVQTKVPAQAVAVDAPAPAAYVAQTTESNPNTPRTSIKASEPNSPAIEPERLVPPTVPVHHIPT